MLRLLVTIVMVLLPAIALAAPDDDLKQARADIAAGKVYAADQALQNIVNAEDATVAELEEALFLQSVIYSGDVLGAVALLQPMALLTTEGSELKAEISRQLLAARRAFYLSINSYLNASFAGSELASLKLDLPPLSAEEVSILQATLRDPEQLNQINSGYAEDPAPGRGLLAQTNLYSFYWAISDAVPGGGSYDVNAVRRRFSTGQHFDHLHYLDWAARVALDMDKLLSEPNGPDLKGLAKKCDERIIALTANDSGSVYAKNARERAGKY
ncbi:hypothetical protein JW859_00845 [bacterium]|nr:hypothetical protein [bacterium]